ncbi:unnamed protein product [Sordaria macrospora k-hell]|uniref:WGS project CABT00000000 data, contig 2.4 n=1 Tax=Sordaria macrospora (strain ATCC MYA-333 / DSM 997 / K(L3346) / K-hell) TaxID=771870 RepID=F7VR29_SORMK|nr:uncharacterized protein SMAC_01525 [Sordaria macrospora k-hell]KAH7634633.1 hypothetical protein B0T09DRAFT_353268 [Sordaria sp. MPI-SDFR-AT-0083]CCC07962.1 unnamed protein product [Sordaria macrospora k-hell]
MGLVCPELIAFTAFQQYTQAKKLTKAMNPPKGSRGHSSRWKAKSKRFWRRMTSCFRHRKNTMDLESSLKPKWTMMHSFLAVMGGFVVEMKDQPGNDDKAEIQSFLPLKSTGTRRTRLTLVPEALRFFKEKGLNSLIPEPSLVHIQDKSKGNTLAKALVCLQGKCTIPPEQRLIGLAISLLELNTFGHAVCTLIIYGLWWSKPLSIDEPEKIPLDTEGISVEAKLLAAMCTKSKLDNRVSESAHLHKDVHSLVFPVESKGTNELEHRININRKGPVERKFGMFIARRRAFEDLVYSPLGYHFSNRHKTSKEPLFLKVDKSEDLLYLVQMTPAEAKQRIASDMNHGNEWDSIKLRGAGFFDRPIDDATPEERLEEISLVVPYVKVLHSDVRRWQLSLLYHGFDTVPPNLLKDRIGNFPRFGEPGTRFGFCLGFSIFGFIYGGLHCVAWNAPFFTDIEKTLWRVSSLTITATIIPVFLVASWIVFPPFWQDPFGRITEIHTVLQNIQANVKPEDWISLLISWVMWIIPMRKIVRLLPQPWEGFDQDMIKGLTHVAYIMLLILFFVYKVIFDTSVILLLIFYTLTRLYLVVVCFINLAHLPDSAYLVPNWSRYVPHIG